MREKYVNARVNATVDRDEQNEVWTDEVTSISFLARAGMTTHLTQGTRRGHPCPLVQRTRMPPPSALSKMALSLRYWLCQKTIDPYRQTCIIRKRQMRDHVDQRLAFSVPSDETNMLSLLFTIHSKSLNYDLDL